VKLISVTVQNFRSITTARRIPIAQLTTLVGPNNEGKSNILRALVIATNSLIAKRAGYRVRSRLTGRQRRARQDRYNWAGDCPIKLQKKPKAGSTITLEFDLPADELIEFQNAVGSKLNGSLPIQFFFGNEEEAITIPKQGPGQKTLTSKVNKIAEFVAAKIELQYIPAVRTAESSQAIVDELVQRELEKIESDPKYQQALTDVAALQEPILDRLSQNITSTMKEFLPNIKTAQIQISGDDRSMALRTLSHIIVDDGAETPLDYKGDGVQSLAAIALMRHVSQLQHAGKDVIVALEEPESHLHPTAIRQLRKVLMELSVRHQVVLTTHNPIFTNRTDFSQNIIVSQSRAFPAKSIKDVRDILGVRLDDNLSSAEIILIVEGEEDKVALLGILPELSSLIGSELSSGRIAIDVLGGASNLNHRIRLHTESLSAVHVMLDDDQAGRLATAKALSEELLNNNQLNRTIAGGKTEAELEDLYSEDVYEEVVYRAAGLQMVDAGPDKQKKWSDRVRNLLKRAGRPNDDLAIMLIKAEVARAAASKGASALQKGRAGPIESLVNSLESTLLAKP
jgi:putative ATP-dependent endonuclease of OLD family